MCEPHQFLQRKRTDARASSKWTKVWGRSEAIANVSTLPLSSTWLSPSLCRHHLFLSCFPLEEVIASRLNKPREVELSTSSRWPTFGACALIMKRAWAMPLENVERDKNGIFSIFWTIDLEQPYWKAGPHAVWCYQTVYLYKAMLIVFETLNWGQVKKYAIFQTMRQLQMSRKLENDPPAKNVCSCKPHSKLFSSSSSHSGRVRRH